MINPTKRNLSVRVFLFTFISLIIHTEIWSQSLSTRLDRYISSYTGVHSFSGVVLVSSVDSIVFLKPYGMANYEWGIPNCNSSKFRIASLSKAFTAALVLQFSEQGKVDLSSPVSRYLPEYTGIYRDSITLRHLLCHSSGIPHYNAVPEFDPEYTRVPVSSSRYIEMISGLKPLFPPGKGYHYSSFGYYLLGAILEKISGMTISALLKENIFLPAGMTGTSFDEMEAIRPFMVNGYSYDHTGIINCRFEDTYKSKGCGGIISTVEDLFIWSCSLEKGSLLSDSSRNLMFRKNKGSNYGYGWVITESSGSKIASHTGSDFGFASFISHNLTEQKCIIILSNLETAPVRRIAEGISKILNGENPEQPLVRTISEVNRNIFRRYEGKYQVAPEYSIEVFEAKNGLEISWTGLHNRLLMFPSSDSTFFIRENDKLFTFNKNNSGLVRSLSFADRQGLITARKVFK